MRAGKLVPIRTLCTAIRDCGCVQKGLQHYAYERDEAQAMRFLQEMNAFYSADQILVLDETAKDRRPRAWSVDRERRALWRVGLYILYTVSK